MNVLAIKENFKELGIELKTFLTIILCANENGAVKIDKKEFAKYLKVSVQTVGKYLRSFADAGILKYKYTGDAIINPDFYYVGADEARASVQDAYKNFKSDM